MMTIVNATAPCMSCTRVHFAQAHPPMSCIPLVYMHLMQAAVVCNSMTRSLSVSLNLRRDQPELSRYTNYLTAILSYVEDSCLCFCNSRRGVVMVLYMEHD